MCAVLSDHFNNDRGLSDWSVVLLPTSCSFNDGVTMWKPISSKAKSGLAGLVKGQTAFGVKAKVEMSRSGSLSYSVARLSMKYVRETW